MLLRRMPVTRAWYALCRRVHFVALSFNTFRKLRSRNKELERECHGLRYAFDAVNTRTADQCQIIVELRQQLKQQEEQAMNRSRRLMTAGVQLIDAAAHGKVNAYELRCWANEAREFLAPDSPWGPK